MASARRARPRTLAAVFGTYLLLVVAGLTVLPTGLESIQYGPDMSTWIYTMALLLGALFLAAIGVGALRSQRTLVLRRIRVMDAASLSDLTSERRLALPEVTDRDVEDLLVTIQHVEASPRVGFREVPDLGPAPSPTSLSPYAMTVTSSRSEEYTEPVGAYIAGPSVVCIVIVAVSSALLPGAGGMMQAYAALNALVALTILFGFAGLAGYVAATFYVLRHLGTGRGSPRGTGRKSKAGRTSRRAGRVSRSSRSRASR